MTEHGMFNIPFRVLYTLTAILFQTIGLELFHLGIENDLKSS